MAESTVCINARASLEEIRSLKREFETAYETAVVSGNEDTAKKAQELKRNLETKIRILRETIITAEAERLFDLKNQYKRQTTLLKKAGLLETGEDGTFFLTGIDGKIYPIPSYEIIAFRLFEQRELLETKADQGFKKFVLVPFGMSLDTMVLKFRMYLLEYKTTHPEFARTDPAVKDASDEVGWNPLWVWEDGYKGADANGTLVYDPVLFDKDNHGGSTKAEILARETRDNDTSAGWRMLLLQGSHDGNGIKGIPRNGTGISEGTKVPRKDIEAGKSPNDYLADQLAGSSDESSAYRGETGMTPEEWIAAFLTHLEETGEPLNNYQNGTDSIAYLTGVYFTASDCVPGAYWFRDVRQAYLFRFGPGSVDGALGVRSAVRA